MFRRRARATNTQLGQEEPSPYTRLDVLSGGGGGGIDVAPEIVVPPDESVTLTRGDSVTELKCIANAKPLHELETVWLKVSPRAKHTTNTSKVICPSRMSIIYTLSSLKDGTPIERAAVAFSYNDLWNRTLSLLSADHGHAGVYTCRVGMRTGGPRLTREARVQVIGK